MHAFFLKFVLAYQHVQLMSRFEIDYSQSMANSLFYNPLVLQFVEFSKIDKLIGMP